jgi:hypothetical protein
MICREVCVNGREGYGVRNVDRTKKRKEKKRKKPCRVRKATAFVPFAFAVQTPLDASRLGRFRGRNARSGDKTCSVASVFADGDEPSGTRARAGGTSGAEEAAARRGAFARGTIRRARADGRPDASAACLGVPPARSPGAKTQPVLIVRYFSCACFGRWREAGREWAVTGA